MSRTTSVIFLLLFLATTAGAMLPHFGGQRSADADLGSVNTYHLDVAARNLILGALGWR